MHFLGQLYRADNEEFSDVAATLSTRHGMILRAVRNSVVHFGVAEPGLSSPAAFQP
jgi:hypothetical protein